MTAKMRAGYKQTEVGMIPGDWTLQSVGNLTTSVASGRSHADSCFGDYPVYGSTGIIGRSARGEYSGRAVLVARVGANAGKLSVVDGEYGVTDNTIMVKVANSTLMDYFWRQLEARRLNSMVFGSGQPLITGTQIKNLVIPLPPTKAEQEAIAEALSDADALIESLEQLLVKKRHLKQGTMQELLTGKKRMPGFSGEWEVKRLGDVADPDQKWSFTGGPFGSNLKSSDYTDTGVRIIQLQNIGDGQFHNDYSVFTSVEKADELLSCNIYPGEIILSKMGDPVARACIIPSFHERYLMCSDGIRLAVNPNRFNAYFVYLVINARDFRVRAENAGTGSTRKRIGLTELRSLELLCPELAEQNAIAEILADMDAEIAELETQLTKTRTLKQGMMHKLLTGEIRLL